MRGVWPLFSCLVALCLSCAQPPGATPPTKPGPGVAASAALTCSADQINLEALQKAGSLDADRAVLPNGRVVTPAGDRISTGLFPIGFTVNAAETRAYVVHNDDDKNALMVMDLEAMQVLQIVPLPSTFRGVVLSPDGKSLYVGGGASGKVRFFDVAPDGQVTQISEVPANGYVADVALSPDGATLYALSNTNSILYIIDTAKRSIIRQGKAGTLPYDLEFSKDGTHLYVSNLGSSTVGEIDPKTGVMTRTVKTGKNPEALATSTDGKRLYVVNSDSDSVSIIDTLSFEVLDTLDLSGDPLFYRHGNLNGLALALDGKRLFVSDAGFNRVHVVDLPTGTVAGHIPTGWYPTELWAGASHLYVISSKGLGAQGQNEKNIPGFLARIPYPDDATLGQWTVQVETNNRRPEVYFKEGCQPENVPVLTGKNSPIEHVVLIVRENKTYDQVLGDFERGDGDPTLCLFPEKCEPGKGCTPNLHKLAREYVNLDNYYSNPEVSIQGHMWTTTAHCNDYTEKAYRDQLPIAGYDPASLPESPTIFDLCFAHGVSFRNYGEFPSFAPYMFDKYMEEFNNKYPFWTLAVKDVDKAAEVIREIELGIFPQFLYIVLPNDHTAGGKAGKPTPQSFVADNDRATAMLVEAISQSIYWPKTAIFIIEDDPQGPADHVEGHRSICIVVSPWVKRGYTSSVHYDIPSVYRTIALILGLPPMGKNDAYAPPMVDIWVDGTVQPPDYQPFTGVPVDVPETFNPKGTALAELSETMDLDKIDGVEGLGLLLWKYFKGDTPIPPYARGIDR